MNTYVIQIGNTDDKLTQQEWYAFVCDVDAILLAYSTTTHFNGGSDSRAAWQNHCWVFQVEERSHDARIFSFADRIARMDDGRIERVVNSPAELSM